MNKKLYVPANIILGRQWWKGFGNKEMLITAVVFLIMVAFVLISTKLGLSMFTAILTAIGVIAATVMCVQKSEGNMSVLDFVIRIYKFKTEQQQFYYETGNE